MSELAARVLKKHGPIIVSIGVDNKFIMSTSGGLAASSFNFTSALLNLLVQDKK